MNKAQAKKNLDQARFNLCKAETDYLKSNGWVFHPDGLHPSWLDPIISSSYPYCQHLSAVKRQTAREV